MLIRQTIFRTYAARTFVLCSLLLLNAGVNAQCTFTKLIPEYIPMGTIPGNAFPIPPQPSPPYDHDFITGHLKYFPMDYSANPTKKYPVIIYLHGHSAQSEGNPNDLCKVLTDMDYSIPWNIENNRFPDPFNYNGIDYRFIVLCPQYRDYNDPWHFATYIDAYITWALSQYRIDPDRIYLTGASAGANLVVDYISSSVDYAKRIAAATIPSLCYRVEQQIASGPSNIAEAKVPTWFMQCSSDGGYCAPEVPADWVSAINAQNEKVTPRFTLLNPPVNPPFPFVDSLLYCRGWAHLTWGAMYYPPQPSGTFEPDFFSWNLQYSRASTLPVTLKNFSLQSTNGKVQLKWVTSSELNNLQFTIERAGTDQKFQKLAVVPGNGTTSVEHTYEFTDNQPLENLNYYRLVQRDIDGREKVFEAKRIMIRRDGKSLVTVSSNPFKTELSAFVTVQHAQQVRLTITDMSGKIWANLNGRYSSGSSEVSLPVNHLPKGVYLLKASGDGLSTVVKLIKQ